MDEMCREETQVASLILPFTPDKIIHQGTNTITQHTPYGSAGDGGGSSIWSMNKW